MRRRRRMKRRRTTTMTNDGLAVLYCEPRLCVVYCEPRLRGSCGVRCMQRASFARLVRCIARLVNEPGVFKVRASHYYSTSLVCEPRSFLQCEPRLRASHTLLCEPRRWLSFASLVCEPRTPYITSLVTEAFFASLANEPWLENEPFARLGRPAVQRGGWSGCCVL